MTTDPIVEAWIRGDQEPPAPVRRVDLTPASAIKPKRVRWIWRDRLALGTLGLLAGREGLGKSTLAYALAADITRGTLDGEYHGQPRAVLICASEDSWEHTIVPRLIAAGADRDLVYRTEIVTHDNLRLNISLPRDFADVELAAETVGAALMILDPLMSVIDSRLDTHRDREVRQALEPLKTLAERARMSILGLIHHNKSGSTDALQLVMGSKAFAAVARSVHTCIPDPDDDTQERRLFATSKNNLGRLDLPVLGFTITGHAVETEDDGVAWTGRLKWTGEIQGSMHEIMTRSADPERTATSEAADWLHDYLVQIGGEAAKTDIEKAGRVAGHTPTSLRRARERLHLEHRSWGFPRRTFWALPITAVSDAADPSQPRHQADTTAVVSGPADTTVEGPASRVTPDDTTTVVPVVPPPDTTVTQLGLTWENTDSPSRAYARARGDDTTDTTDSVTRLEDPSRASRASRVTGPTHAREPYATVAGNHPTEHGKPWTPAFPGQRPPFQPGNNQGVAPDWDGPIPLCPDCGFAYDTTDHARLCEDLT